MQINKSWFTVKNKWGFKIGQVCFSQFYAYSNFPQVIMSLQCLQKYIYLVNLYSLSYIYVLQTSSSSYAFFHILPGIYRAREEETGAVSGRQQETGETEERADGGLQEATQTHWRTQKTKGEGFFLQLIDVLKRKEVRCFDYAQTHGRIQETEGVLYIQTLRCTQETAESGVFYTQTHGCT